MSSTIKSLLLISIFVLTGCSFVKEKDSDFVDDIINLSIERSNDEYIQLPDLYDTLTNVIPDDKDEKLILGERLKQRGFEVSNWGRGNFPPLGPRIVNVELKKDDCICDVTKIYMATPTNTLFQMVEGISCRKAHQ